MVGLLLVSMGFGGIVNLGGSKYINCIVIGLYVIFRVFWEY